MGMSYSEQDSLYMCRQLRSVAGDELRRYSRGGCQRGVAMPFERVEGVPSEIRACLFHRANKIDQSLFFPLMKPLVL